MTYLDRKSANSGPRTHAIVIGVNAYPHLLGGNSSLSSATMGLGQLTSPVLSAHAFASWVETKLNNPDAPLDTIELLLSPDTSTAGHVPPSVARATMQNIKDAFGRWYQRCDLFEANVALFYFCGHGLEPRELILLPEDFGSNPLDIWDTAVDMTRTYYGMAECKARTQCYFIDACREQPIEALAPMGVVPRPLKAISSTSLPYRVAPFMKSAPLTQRAFGLSGNKSYFTSTLLDCLNGFAATDFDGRWWHVTTDSLLPSINRCLERVRLPDGRTLRCSPTGGEQNGVSSIHRFAGSAPVLARIACYPPSAMREADLFLHPREGSPHQRSSKGSDPWDTVITSGIWGVEARFPESGCPWRTTSLDEQLAYPPYFGPTVRLENSVSNGTSRGDA